MSGGTATGVAPVLRAPTLGARTGLTRALTMIEGRRMISHPAFLGFAALSALLVAVVLAGLGESNSTGDDAYLYVLVTGSCCIPIAIGTFIAAHLGASRSRRNETEPQFRSLPVRPGQRMIAHLLAVSFPVAVATALVTILATASLADGISLTFEEGRRSASPSLFEFLQGPLFVALAGVVGIAAARLLPNPLLPFLIIPAAFAQMIGTTWMIEGNALLFAPLVQHLRVESWIDLTDPVESYPVLSGVETGMLAWHLVYLAGLICVAAVIAIRPRPGGRTAGLVGAALSVTALGGAMQLLAWSAA